MKKLYTSLKEYFKTKRNDYILKVNLISELEKHEDIILVYQMGKVGSKSIENSLKRLKLKNPLYHFHALNPERVNGLIIGHQKRKTPIEKNLKMAQILWDEVIKPKRNDKNWKIITLVRDPVARNFAAFFQNINDYFPDFYQRHSSGLLETDTVINKFITEYPHHVPLTWLDEEIKFVFDIDIFAVEFPKAKGYTIIHQENIDLLVIKLEYLNKCHQQAFSEFLNIDNFILKKDNVGSQKVYANAYKEFLQNIILSEDYLDQMYMSKYTKHFYTDEEIKTFRDKYSSSNT
jgi:hypothetical protein